MGITQEQLEYLSNKYKDCIQDMLRQNMPFFKFRQQPIWRFIQLYTEYLSALSLHHEGFENNHNETYQMILPTDLP